jgi:hypothetical protein
LKIGDNVRLKKEYNVSISFGNIGFKFAGGSKAIILQVEDNATVVSVGFFINETIEITALVDRDIFESIS